jgi:hypothetical protein
MPDGALPDSEPVRFDTKIAVLLRSDLEVWQRLNVTAFLVSGLGPRVPEVIGEPYLDADETEYLPMFRQPVLVFEGSKEALAAAHARAAARGLALSVFTADLFATGNDRDNRAAVGPCGVPILTWSVSPSTGRVTPSTRSPRARACTRSSPGLHRLGMLGEKTTRPGAAEWNLPRPLHQCLGSSESHWKRGNAALSLLADERRRSWER